MVIFSKRDKCHVAGFIKLIKLIKLIELIKLIKLIRLIEGLIKKRPSAMEGLRALILFKTHLIFLCTYSFKKFKY